MAAPSFRSIGTSAVGTGDVSPSLPAGYLSEDYLILHITSARQTPVPPAPWTFIASQGRGTAGAAGGIGTFIYGAVGADVSGAPTIPDVGSYTFAVITAWKDVYTGGVVVTAANGNNANSSASIGMASPTTGYVDQLIVYTVGTDRDNEDSTGTFFSGFANTDLTGLAEHFDRASSSGSGGALGVFSGAKAAIGPTANAGVTSTNADVYAAVSCALRGIPEVIPKGGTRLLLKATGRAAFVNNPPVIGNAPEAQATAGVPYSFTPTATGGTLPYTWERAGTLPAGLSFNSSTGAITGTPSSAGVFDDGVITVADATGLRSTALAFEITVTSPPGLVLPADVTYDWGMKTHKGAGDLGLGYTGSGYLGITSGNTGSLFTVSNNKLRASGPATTAAPYPTYESGGYVLGLTEYSDAGLTTPTGVTGIARLTMVEHAYSVATSSQLLEVIQCKIGTGTIATAQQVKWGDTIYMRAGNYGGFGASKTVTYGQRVGGPVQPVGWARSEPGWVTIRPDIGKEGQVLTDLVQLGGGTWGLKFYRLNMFRANSNRSNRPDNASTPVFRTTGVCVGIYIDRCDIRSQLDIYTYVDPVSGASSPRYAQCAGIRIYDASTDWHITNNRIDMVDYGVIGGGSKLNRINIIGNDIRNPQADDLNLIGNNIVVAFNEFKDRIQENIPAHGDALQINPQNVGTVSGITIVANAWWRGDGLDGDSDRQGIFMGGGAPLVGGTVNNLQIRGNLLQVSAVNALQLYMSTDPIVEFNTGVRSGAPFISGLRKLRIEQSTNNPTTGGSCQYNVFEQFEGTSAFDTVDHNVTIATTGSGPTTYANLFDNPDTSETSDLATMEARYAAKAGGMLIDAVTGYTVGGVSSYINRQTRQTSFPFGDNWDFSDTLPA